MPAVKIAGMNMVDTDGYRFAQHRDRLVMIHGRPNTPVWQAGS
jgi:hypothetical protein